MMNMISKQVQDLRELSRNCRMAGGKEIENALKEAADTIESLSAQLQKSNMEQSEKPIERFEWIKKNRGERPKHLAQTHNSKLGLLKSNQ